MEDFGHEFIKSGNSLLLMDIFSYTCKKCELRVLHRKFEDFYYFPIQPGQSRKKLDMSCDEYTIKKLLE